MARVPQLIVVDPDKESSTEMAKTLSTLGFQVQATAGYGVEAFTLCFQLRPDLILMRIEEPLVRPVQTLSRTVHRAFVRTTPRRRALQRSR